MGAKRPKPLTACYRVPDDIDMGWLLAYKTRYQGPPGLLTFASGIREALQDGYVVPTRVYTHFTYGVKVFTGNVLGVRLMAGSSPNAMTRWIDIRIRPLVLARIALQRPVMLRIDTPPGIVADYLVDELGERDDASICRLLWWIQDLTGGGG